MGGSEAVDQELRAIEPLPCCIFLLFYLGEPFAFQVLDGFVRRIVAETIFTVLFSALFFS